MVDKPKMNNHDEVPTPRMGPLCWFQTNDARDSFAKEEWELGYFQEWFWHSKKDCAVAVIITLRGEVVERFSARVRFSQARPDGLCI
jgi:hypothetical protein